MYFDWFGWDGVYVLGMLIFVGIVEFLVVVLFVIVFLQFVCGKLGVVYWIDLVIVVFVVVFFGFVIFDVVVGDWVELLEYLIYVGVLFVLFLVVLVESFFCYLCEVDSGGLIECCFLNV